MIDFSGFGLPPALMQTLARMQYTTPTPIQAQAIPLGLAGRDVLGSAQTGTGKTAAFGIPLVVRLMTNPRGSALVLTPTRELAVQVIDVMQQLLGGSAIRTALLIGGDPMNPQLQQLRARPRLIVGTPGRINDHLARGTLMLHDTSFLVLDETDRMLDMGFASQLEQIARFLPKTRQTLMFSATLPANILSLSEKYLTNPARVSAGPSNATAANIQHEVIHASDTNKYELLVAELNRRQGSIIVFVKTKRGADRLSGRLNRQNHSSDAIHGDLHQRRRERVIDGFREKKFRIMVATDVAARGLDIPHIEHVINYDLPHAPEDYIHRVGRTARAGAEGSAVCLISPEDGSKWKAIQRMLHPEQRIVSAENAGGGADNARPRNGKRRPRYRRRSGSAQTGAVSGHIPASMH